MSELKGKYCRACEAGMPAMSAKEAEGMMDQVPGWELDESKLVRQFKFKNFKQAMVFVNQVADIANQEGHHPDIFISWNRVRLDMTTHIIKGLSENDFIMAAKIDEVVSSR